MDICWPVTKRVMRYMQISQSLESAMSAATRAAFHVSRQTLQKVSCYRRPRVYHRHFRGAPQSPFGSYDRRIGAAGSSVPRDAPSASRIVEFTPRRRARRIRSARGGAHRFIRGRLLRRDARRKPLHDRSRRSAIGTGKRTRGIDDAQRRGVAPSGSPRAVHKPRRPIVSPGAAKRR